MAYLNITEPGICADCRGPLPVPRHGRRMRCFECARNAGRPLAREKFSFEKFADDWNAGMPTEEIATKYGVCTATIYKATKAAGTSRKRGPMQSPDAESRARQMIDAYTAGLSLEKIGEIHGVTRERVRQIISKRGVTRFDGGPSIRAEAKKATRAFRIAANRDERSMRVYGCLYAGLEALLGKGVQPTSNKATKAYVHQKRNSAKRGIKFSLTFPQWWAVWQKSGKWEQRGRGQGYVMARTGDVGSYSVGNVYICTQSQNSKDSFIKTPASVRALKAKLNPNSKTRLGNGRGWTYQARCKARPYQVMVGKDRIGNFATEQEARSAYVEECNRRQLELKSRLRNTTNPAPLGATSENKKFTGTTEAVAHEL
ncbi:sigma factor-like helix-turn-helix DNA-binding protein [Paraburkholderia caledonica]|uniref:RNA polymerase sigma-70 region 4 domain-containing protein n=1 Tax=Paraburkholderia caledonica TaxID=134536 RepID=A0AB73IS09_9BURK|nr:hypothetical protein [Paraburkholderia caledonica]